MLIVVQVLIVLAAIILGTRLGLIVIGLTGGLGVLALNIAGILVTRDDIPSDVTGIIMSVIAAIAAMQRADGMGYLVHPAERLFRKNPCYTTYWASVVTCLITLLTGTGHTALSTLPVIAEVSKEGGVRPSRPLPVAVIISQLAATVSPISVVAVLMASPMESRGAGYLTLLAIVIPSTFLTILPTTFVTNHLGREPDDDPGYQNHLEKGLVSKPRGQMGKYMPTESTKQSVTIFLLSILAVIVYATTSAERVGLVADPTLPRNETIMSIMLTTITVTVLACRLDAAATLNTPVSKSSMSASVCIPGIAQLGTIIINHYIGSIKTASGSVPTAMLWMLAIVFFFAAASLYSRAATTKATMPAALAIGVSFITAVAPLAATSALSALPTYPTLLIVVEMGDTGTTRISKYVFDYSSIVLGTLYIVLPITFGFAFDGVLLQARDMQAWIAQPAPRFMARIRL